MLPLKVLEELSLPIVNITWLLVRLLLVIVPEPASELTA
jgi:hypothetical protein